MVSFARATPLLTHSFHHVGSNQITDKGACALADALMNNTLLRDLDLSANPISKEGADALGAMLETNSCLRRLNLNKNSFSNNDAVAIGRSLEKNTTLRRLQLSKNSLTQADWDAIGQGLVRNTSLMELQISKKIVQAEDMHAISEALSQNASLTRLDLSVVHLCDEAVELFALALQKTPGLQYLSILSDCYQEDELFSNNSMKILCHALANNTTITVLDLGCSDEADFQEHLRYLVKNNTSIRRLRLHVKTLMPNLAHVVHAFAHNCSIESFHVGIVTEETVLALAEALRTNTSLTHTCLSYFQRPLVGVGHIATSPNASANVNNHENDHNDEGDNETANASNGIVAVTNFMFPNANVNASTYANSNAHADANPISGVPIRANSPRHGHDTSSDSEHESYNSKARSHHNDSKPLPPSLAVAETLRDFPRLKRFQPQGIDLGSIAYALRVLPEACPSQCCHHDHETLSPKGLYNDDTELLRLKSSVPAGISTPPCVCFSSCSGLDGDWNPQSLPVVKTRFPNKSDRGQTRGAWTSDNVLEYLYKLHQDKVTAFAMGQHERLGQDSAVQRLVLDCVKMVMLKYYRMPVDWVRKSCAGVMEDAADEEADAN